MGRTLKRVPLDFDYPLNKTWDGYLSFSDDDEYEPIEPPSGDGFQMWETTSEGSPQSPVFKTIEELGEWCATNATVFAGITATKEDWIKMLSEDKVHARVVGGNGTEMIFI